MVTLLIGIKKENFSKYTVSKAMGTTGGIGIGIAIGIALTLSFVVFFGVNQGSPVLENIPTIVYNEPKLASLQSSYDDDTGRLTVALILTETRLQACKKYRSSVTLGNN